MRKDDILTFSALFTNLMQELVLNRHEYLWLFLMSEHHWCIQHQYIMIMIRVIMRCRK